MLPAVLTPDRPGCPVERRAAGAAIRHALTVGLLGSILDCERTITINNGNRLSVARSYM
jgi:hypothetical protein